MDATQTHGSDGGRDEDKDILAKRNVLVLSFCLALSMTGTSAIMVVTALTGQSLANPTAVYTAPFLGEFKETALATLPLTLQFVGTMIATIPASLLMRHIGRRIGFTLGQGIGVAGALLAAYAILEASFWTFAASGVLIGFHNAFWQYYRFAAAETASASYKSKAISLVMAGGVFAAIFGPEIAKYSAEVFAPALFAGTFVAISLLCLATIILLQFLRIPKQKKEELVDSGRPLRVIVKQPIFITAMLAAMFGYASMSLVMTATPLAMAFCGFDLHDTKTVIQWHALGMFAPSFFTGSLISRFGVLRIIQTGATLMFGCVAVGLMGIEFMNFWVGLVLLGLGWNFMFIGGTTLLTDAYLPAERNKVQALNDFIVFGSVSIASFSAGWLQDQIGWSAVSMAIVLPVAIALIAALLYGSFQSRSGPTPAQ